MDNLLKELGAVLAEVEAPDSTTDTDDATTDDADYPTTDATTTDTDDATSTTDATLYSSKSPTPAPSWDPSQPASALQHFAYPMPITLGHQQLQALCGCCYFFPFNGPYPICHGVPLSPFYSSGHSSPQSLSPIFIPPQTSSEAHPEEAERLGTLGNKGTQIPNGGTQAQPSKKKGKGIHLMPEYEYLQKRMRPKKAGKRRNQEQYTQGGLLLTETNHCTLCKSNRELEEVFLSHQLSDQSGKVTCPVLRKCVCPLCNATGDDAHTLKYCPKNPDVPQFLRPKNWTKTNANGESVESEGKSLKSGERYRRVRNSTGMFHSLKY